jgi:hypothetical protein
MVPARHSGLPRERRSRGDRPRIWLVIVASVIAHNAWALASCCRLLARRASRASSCASPLTPFARSEALRWYQAASQPGRAPYHRRVRGRAVAGPLEGHKRATIESARPVAQEPADPVSAPDEGSSAPRSGPRSLRAGSLRPLARRRSEGDRALPFDPSDRAGRTDRARRGHHAKASRAATATHHRPRRRWRPHRVRSRRLLRLPETDRGAVGAVASEALEIHREHFDPRRCRAWNSAGRPVHIELA